MRSIFSDIIKGFSEYNSIFGKVFFKHSNQIDSAEIENRAAEYSEIAKEDGLPTSEEQEKFIIEQGLWSNKQNSELKDLQYFLAGLKLTREKVTRKADIRNIASEILDTESKINILTTEKNRLLGLTVEAYTNKKIFDYNLFYILYKDIENKVKLFSAEEFHELEDSEVESLKDLYVKHYNRFKETDIKKTAISPHFINSIAICGEHSSAFEFYGIPIINLTYFQVDLYSKGRFYYNIISQHRDDIPDSYLSDPEKLELWYKGKKNADEILGKSKDGQTIGIVADKEDFEVIAGKDTKVVKHSSLIGKSIEEIAML